MTRAASTAALSLALLTGFGLRGATPVQAPTYRLRLSDRVGQASRYRLVFEIRMRAQYSGPGQPDARVRQLMETLASGMRLRTAVEYEQKLAAVAPDGTRTFEIRWHDYQFSGEVGEREIPPPPGHNASTRELLSQTARVHATPTGRTIDVTYAHPRLAGLARQFQQMDGAMPTYLPERPVAVGDSWTSTARFPVGLSPGGTGTMTLELEHTLKEVRQGPDGPIAVIELSGSYSQFVGAEEIGLATPMHLQASLTGSADFDIAHGRFSGGHYEIDMFALHAAEGTEIELIGHANGRLELKSGR